MKDEDLIKEFEEYENYQQIEGIWYWRKVRKNTGEK
jgi:hypothetical protein